MVNDRKFVMTYLVGSDCTVLMEHFFFSKKFKKITIEAGSYYLYIKVH